jgi:hypothetical protein
LDWRGERQPMHTRVQMKILPKPSTSPHPQDPFARR